MELHPETLISPARDAATVVMLRDTDQGLEVFLIKRHGLSDVLGGAYVFPGGKLDGNDAELDMATHLDQAGHALHDSLNEPELDATTAASLYVAALREAFEESGVLFVENSDETTAAQAHALLRQGMSFNEVLGALSLRLQTQNVLPWSRWITPRIASISSKRFDTRFFVAQVPADQTALHDNHEATESAWLAPRSALTQYWQGEIELAPPQIMSLAHLARHPTVASVLTEARARKPPVIEPQAHQQDGVRVLCYPGDVMHTVRERALPGPTRLLHQNKRFEPVQGFDALFA
jgi:8-oxo-dGTP pyrophosphatase MutT (NUDIX family)